MSEYTWRLSHEKSDASISETVHFVPAKLVIWGRSNIAFVPKFITSGMCL